MHKHSYGPTNELHKKHAPTKNENITTPSNIVLSRVTVYGVFQ